MAKSGASRAKPKLTLKARRGREVVCAEREEMQLGGGREEREGGRRLGAERGAEREDVEMDKVGMAEAGLGVAVGECDKQSQHKSWKPGCLF